MYAGTFIKTISRKATMNCTFLGGKGECQCGEGGMRVAGTGDREGICGFGEKVL